MDDSLFIRLCVFLPLLVIPLWIILWLRKRTRP